MRSFGLVLLAFFLALHFNICESRYIYIRDTVDDKGGFIRKSDACLQDGSSGTRSKKYSCNLNEASFRKYSQSNNCTGESDYYHICDISETCQCLDEPVKGYYVIEVEQPNCTLDPEISLVMQEDECTKYDVNSYAKFFLESDNVGIFRSYSDPDCTSEHKYEVKGRFDECTFIGDHEAWYFSESYPLEDKPGNPEEEEEETSSSIYLMDGSSIFYIFIAICYLLI